MEQADVRGEQHGLPWIVRDEDGGLAESAGNTQELLLNLMPRHRIESAERLVEQQRLLVRRKRAGDALCQRPRQRILDAQRVARHVVRDRE